MKGFVFLIIASLFLFSCKKNSPEPTTSVSSNAISTGTATTVYHTDAGTGYANALNIYSEINEIIEMAYKNAAYGSCTKVKFDTLCQNSMDTLTIDFGSENCMDPLGVFRKGKIVCQFQPHSFNDSLGVKTISLVNYTVNDVKVNGSASITNLGKDKNGSRQIRLMSSGNIYKTGLMLCQLNTTLYFTTVQGSIPHVQSWSLSGVSNGIDKNGVSFSASMIIPVQRDESCHWLKKGTVMINLASLKTEIVDFGTGSCDNMYTVMSEDKTFSFTFNH